MRNSRNCFKECTPATQGVDLVGILSPEYTPNRTKREDEDVEYFCICNFDNR